MNIWFGQTEAPVNQERYSVTMLLPVNIDQVDWDTALRKDNGRINTLGLYDLDRNIRDVGKAYKHIIKQWSPVLEKESVGLRL